ncbi:probable inactive receptor kinase At1g48480 [Solanum stenotomum]|uniref:probable inactive receptor kinase At1g48480 n=1 Tax=Solanum stenotomum TaxID=172797 RepID=UPI0020D1280D|nr:probable inactive receptor kinase At1g48480 [Solanum stenotomum]
MPWSPTDIVGIELVFFGDHGGYGLDELLRSTAGVLGKGVFGTSYKSELPGKNAVAVKRLKVGCLAEEEFRDKIGEVGKMVHENLLPLRGYCWHQNEILLVYDYVRMGSLAFRLHGNEGRSKASLTWEVRSSIAYGVARAIEFLHSRGSDFCHGNIRSSNVFLTDSLSGVHLSEFSIARILSSDTRLELVAGYRAPEVTNAHEVSQKSDVYSFGVLLLELLTGKAPLDAFTKNKGVDLPKWIRSMFQEKPVIDVFDTLLPKHDQSSAEQMVLLLQLAVCCTFQYPNKRPSMAAVTKQIRGTCRFY